MVREVFFWDPESRMPIGEATAEEIRYNLSASMDMVKFWTEMVTRGWLYWVSRSRCGVELDDGLIETIVEFCGMERGIY